MVPSARFNALLEPVAAQHGHEVFCFAAGCGPTSKSQPKSTSSVLSLRKIEPWESLGHQNHQAPTNSGAVQQWQVGLWSGSRRETAGRFYAVGDPDRGRREKKYNGRLLSGIVSNKLLCTPGANPDRKVPVAPEISHGPPRASGRQSSRRAGIVAARMGQQHSRPPAQGYRSARSVGSAHSIARSSSPYPRAF
jgi:hypothetical protein